MSAPEKALKGPARELSSFERALLCAMVQNPSSSPQALSRITGVSTGRARRARGTLREEGVWAPGYDIDQSQVAVGPLVACWLRLRPGASLDRFSPALAAALRESGATGLCLHEGEIVAGLLSGGGLDALARFENALHGPAWELMHFDLAVFARVPGFSFTPINYGGVLGSPPRPAGGRAPAPRRRRFNPTVVAVGRDLLLHAGATVAEGAERVGVSRSSYAHSKSSLLRAGVLRPRVRLHLPALGFRFLLVTTRHHRPIREHRAHAKMTNAGASTPPLSLLLSPTRGFVVRPFGDLQAAKEEDRRWLAESQALELAGPPRSAIFSYAGLRLVVHCAPGGLQDAWIAGLGSFPVPAKRP